MPQVICTSEDSAARCGPMRGVNACLVQSGLDTLHVPYSYGWSIILLTLLVKLALLPITKKQVGQCQVYLEVRCC